ncbi:hypothetical protein C8R44DRAFT_747251 [Mycena epipterygia]|nr:hypothetical protein C8R44DRAFT_747251 [Mycena epipterygia]
MGTTKSQDRDLVTIRNHSRGYLVDAMWYGKESMNILFFFAMYGALDFQSPEAREGRFIRSAVKFQKLYLWLDYGVHKYPIYGFIHAPGATLSADQLYISVLKEEERRQQEKEHRARLLESPKLRDPRTDAGNASLKAVSQLAAPEPEKSRDLFRFETADEEHLTVMMEGDITILGSRRLSVLGSETISNDPSNTDYVQSTKFSEHPKNGIELELEFVLRQKNILLNMGSSLRVPINSNSGENKASTRPRGWDDARTDGGRGKTATGMGMGQAEECGTTRGRAEDTRTETRWEGNREIAEGARAEERAEHMWCGAMGLRDVCPTSHVRRADLWWKRSRTRRKEEIVDAWNREVRLQTRRVRARRSRLRDLWFYLVYFVRELVGHLILHLVGLEGVGFENERQRTNYRSRAEKNKDGGSADKKRGRGCARREGGDKRENNETRMKQARMRRTVRSECRRSERAEGGRARAQTGEDMGWKR